MAIHTNLPVYKLASNLLDLSTDLTCNFPRKVRGVATRIDEACLSMLVLIGRANAARNKTPALDELLEQLHVAEILFRLSLDKRYISPRQYARAAGVCAQIGRQAGGWRRSQPSTSAA